MFIRLGRMCFEARAIPCASQIYVTIFQRLIAEVASGEANVIESYGQM